ncbi:MAG: class I SAM-dependent methyltransferase [Nitrospirota bacterium]|nr:class I SAM-dependent methyltransferase [Nitrospirota bacterium]
MPLSIPEFTPPAPDPLLRDHISLFADDLKDCPLLDLACGDGHNGLFLASKGFSIILADRSEDALKQAGQAADSLGVSVTLRHIDLEGKDSNPFENDVFSAVLVFRYLHRPLIPQIRISLRKGGLLMYETFTTEQAQFGKPKNPEHLLNPGELISWFQDWEIIHSFEGIKEYPKKAVAQIVCRKP